MTPSDMIALGKDLLGEVEGSPGDRSPLTWNRWLLMAAKEICQATDCLYRDYALDIVAGQSLYCASPLYKLVGASLSLPDGTARTLTFRTARDMAGQFLPGGATGVPSMLAAEGDNRFALWPVPNYSNVTAAYTDLASTGLSVVSSALRPFVSTDVGQTLRITSGPGWPMGQYVITSVSAGLATLPSLPSFVFGAAGVGELVTGSGLTVEGYGVPDDAWVTSTNDCPLPSRAHEVVVFRAALLRCAQFPPASPSLPQFLEQQFRYAKGMLEGQVAVMTSANRQRMTEKVGGGPAYGGFDPLGRW